MALAFIFPEHKILTYSADGAGAEEHSFGEGDGEEVIAGNDA